MFTSINNLIIKVGGSLLYNEDLTLNLNTISFLQNNLDRLASKHKRIVLVCGGGYLSRFYQSQFAKLGISDEKVHFGGLMTNMYSSALVSLLFSSVTEVSLPNNSRDIDKVLRDSSQKIVITGGYKVRESSDGMLLHAAEILGESTVFKLSKIDMIYDKNPELNVDALGISRITWMQLVSQFDIDLSNPKHNPGAHTPIDQKAIRLGSQMGADFYLGGGRNIVKDTTLEEIFQSGTLVTKD